MQRGDRYKMCQIRRILEAKENLFAHAYKKALREKNPEVLFKCLD